MKYALFKEKGKNIYYNYYNIDLIEDTCDYYTILIGKVTRILPKNIFELREIDEVRL